MSDTEDPSEEWQVRAQDWQTASEWLAKRVDALQRHLAQAHSQLEAQRTATYQAVAREHAAKKQLALARRA